MNTVRFLAALALIFTSPLFASEPGREADPSRDKTALPEYIIEPPDVISIELPRPIPMAYHVGSFDVVRIDVANALSAAPLHGDYPIAADGTVNLGTPYGSVRVADMTIDDAMQAVDKHLQKFISKPDGSVQLAKASRAQPVTGQYLVGPDGTINLPYYGAVKIIGKTMTEARIAIDDHLKQFLETPRISLNVVAYNSKVYYVITRKAGQADDVRRFPITGNETVLDAIAQVCATLDDSDKKSWISRPAPHHFGHEQILPIDWIAVTQGAATAVNYQILPGDRLFVEESVRGFSTAGRNYNRTRNGL